MVKEQFFNCAYCGETVSMILDLSLNHQTYVEDCEVCCQPLDISYSVEDMILTSFSAVQQNE